MGDYTEADIPTSAPNFTTTAQPDTDTDVIIVGGGLSGISTLYRTRKLGLKAVILESGTDLGGVWHHNHYPGARVDSEWPYYQLNIPEVYTTFAFTERFPGGEELRRYIAHVDSVLDLRRDTIFDAFVNDCSWDEQTARWTVKTEQGLTVRGRYLILCTGLLHRRHYPTFPGIENFKGQVIHSGFWSDEIKTKDKKIALIGAGATAVQITQEVAKEAEQLTVLMRRPSYCLPMTQRTLSEAENRSFHVFYDTLFRAGRQSFSGFPYAPASKSLLDDSPEDREKALNDSWTRGGFQFPVNYTPIFVSEEASKIAYEFWSRKTRARMRPGKKRDLVAPPVDKMPYLYGTKRTPLEQDYYEMIDQDNVDVINMVEKKIKTFTERGLVYEDGDELDFDMLVLATGFDSFSGSVTNMGLKNKHGTDIKDVWKAGIKTYLGITFSGFPNTFMVYSPHAPTILTNGPTMIEAQADMVVNLIARMERDGIRTLEPLSSAQDDWVSTVDAMGQNTLFCRTSSWWNGGNVPGKKAQMLTYVGGLSEYEAQCKGLLRDLAGFEVRYYEKEMDRGKREVGWCCRFEGEDQTQLLGGCCARCAIVVA